MTFTITLWELLFLLAGILEAITFVYLITEVFKGGSRAAAAIMCLFFMIPMSLATFFLYAGIYLW